MKNLSITDPWIKERKLIEVFYRKYFKVTIDWSKIIFPDKAEEFPRLEYLFPELKIQEILCVYAKSFINSSGWHSVFSHYSYYIDYLIKNEQERPKENYVFCHTNKTEPELNLSYDEAVTKKINFMTAKEGLISAFRHRAETGEIYDLEKSTEFSTTTDGMGDEINMMMRNTGDCLVLDKNVFGLDHKSDKYRALRQICFVKKLPREY